MTANISTREALIQTALETAQAYSDSQFRLERG
jgi:hypothetical protein